MLRWYISLFIACSPKAKDISLLAAPLFEAAITAMHRKKERKKERNLLHQP